MVGFPIHAVVEAVLVGGVWVEATGFAGTEATASRAAAWASTRAAAATATATTAATAAGTSTGRLGDRRKGLSWGLAG